MLAAVWIRRASGALVVLVILLLVMTLKAVRDGERELSASDKAFDRGDLAETVLHARRAATAYAPGAPHTRVALARLRAVAVGSEAASDHESARLAWGAIRAAALETRHLTLPYAAELAEANTRLEALTPSRSRADAAANARTKSNARALLGRVPGPSLGATLLLVGGFTLSLGGLFFVALRGLTREGRAVARPLAIGIAAFLAGALCWISAIYRA